MSSLYVLCCWHAWWLFIRRVHVCYTGTCTPESVFLTCVISFTLISTKWTTMSIKLHNYLLAGSISRLGDRFSGSLVLLSKLTECLSRAALPVRLLFYVFIAESICWSPIMRHSSPSCSSGRGLSHYAFRYFKGYFASCSCVFSHQVASARHVCVRDDCVRSCTTDD